MEIGVAYTSGVLAGFEISGLGDRNIVLHDGAGMRVRSLGLGFEFILES